MELRSLGQKVTNILYIVFSVMNNFDKCFLCLIPGGQLDPLVIVVVVQGLLLACSVIAVVVLICTRKQGK